MKEFKKYFNQTQNLNESSSKEVWEGYFLGSKVEITLNIDMKKGNQYWWKITVGGNLKTDSITSQDVYPTLNDAINAGKEEVNKIISNFYKNIKK